MANTNPGPAINGLPSSVLTTIPVNNGPTGNSNPVLTDALRLIATYRGFNVAQAGDYPMPVFNSSRFVPSAILFAVNSATTVAASAAFLSAASISVYPGAGATGTALMAAAAGPTLAANTLAVGSGTVVTTLAVTASTVYFRVNTAATTAAYFDAFLYAYDLS